MSSSGYGPRSNPLYGGPPVSIGAPSWTAVDDQVHVHAFESSPPQGLPDESHAGYIPPSVYQDDQDPYSYQAQRYYVQTPSGKYASDGNPPDSAYEHVSLPADYVPQEDQQYFQPAVGLTAYDGHAVMSSSRHGGKSRSYAGRVTGDMIGEGDSDKIPLYQEQEKSAKLEKQGRRKFWKICFLMSLLGVVLCIAAGSVFCWLYYQPLPPTFNFEGATMSNLLVVNRLSDDPRSKFLKKAWTLVGVHGQPTDSMNLNLTVHLSAVNPNRAFTMSCDGGKLQSGYTYIKALMQTKIPKFEVNAHQKFPFTANMSVHEYPLYNAGPRVRKDIRHQIMGLSLRTSIQSHVQVLWWMVQATYQHDLDCDLVFNPVTYEFLNNTCTFQRKK